MSRAKGPTYLILLILVATVICVLSCRKPEPPPTQDCIEHFGMDTSKINALLFDYENTDTLRYRRIIDTQIDTLVFVLTTIVKDSLFEYSSEIRHECRNEPVTYYDHWKYKYECMTEKNDINVQLKGTGSNVQLGGPDFVFNANGIHFREILGSPLIGNKGFKYYVYQYSTGTGIYTHNWRIFSAWSTFKFVGNRVEGLPDPDSSTCVYNPDYGMIEMQFANQTWELIPN